MIRQLSALALVTAASVLACNAIIGVEDVKAKASSSGRDSGTSSSGGDDDDTTLDDGGGSGFDDSDHPTLALGFNHGCARMLDSTVRCWGDNGAGQLGDGADLSPAQDPGLPPK